MASNTRDAKYSRKYRAEHREQVRESNRAYVAANREKYQALAQKYRDEHRAELNAKSRAYRLANPEKRRGYHANRREMLRTAAGNYTDAQWVALRAWLGDVCVACGDNGPLTADHVVPITAGGSNDIGNLQPLCGSCNSAKHDKTIDYRDPVLLAAFIEITKGTI